MIVTRLASYAIAHLVIAALLLVPAGAGAQGVCTGSEVVSGLERPQGITQSPLGNLLVAESGIHASNTGRISVVGPSGDHRVLLAGLPSGLSDVGDPAGPSGVFMRGRTLYVAIGIGDAILAGPLPRTAEANPDSSSPIFSSILAVHFSANVERTTAGFTLSAGDQETLASGRRVTLSNGGGDTIAIELVADFPDYVAEPLPQLSTNVRGSNPFDLVGVANQLYVTDGGRNLVWQVDVPTGAFSPLATFPAIQNPLPVGPPFVEAVPTGIAYVEGHLLVALLRGAPFPAGTSVVEAIDPATGAHATFIGGLKTAIDVLAIGRGGATAQLVLQHSSGPMPFFAGPGVVLRFDTPSAPAETIDSCLARPTSMVLDDRTNTLYVAELETGRIVAIPVQP